MAVLDPDTSTSGSLPGAQWETDHAEMHCARKTVLRNHDATRARVLAALKQCEAAHFACHGIANFDDPSSSRLELEVSQVEARSIGGPTAAHRARHIDRMRPNELLARQPTPTLRRTFSPILRPIFARGLHTNWDEHARLLMHSFSLCRSCLSNSGELPRTRAI